MSEMSAELVRVRHPQLGRIVTHVERPPAEAVQILSRCYTGLISDALGKLGTMYADVKPIAPGMRLCGPAVTFWGDDWTAKRHAYEMTQRGDVLVIAGGTKDLASFGDFSATVLFGRRAAGAVIDGATRDVDGIARLGLPVFARAVTMRNRHYPSGPQHCAINLPVACAGALVNPGDVIVGDSDGVVVVPAEIALDLARLLERELEQEIPKRQRVGASGFSFGLLSELLELGYAIE